MSENVQKSSSTRNFLGAVLIIIGLLFFLDEINLFNIDVPDIIFSFPFIMFAVGVLIILNSRNKTFGTILTVLGLFFLIPEIFPAIDYDGKLIFPVVIIALGVYIIVKSRAKQTDTDNEFMGTHKMSKDIIDDIAIFGGGTKVINSDNFKGGSVTAIFGGSEIDLTNCKLADGDNFIDVLCLFGGSTFIVPKNWDVQINVTSILGGFSNKIVKSPADVTDTSKTLFIKGLVMFGGGEVKNYY